MSSEGETLHYPESGVIEALLGLGLFVHLLDLATPVLVAELGAATPSLVPEPLTTGLAVSVWAVTALTAAALWKTRAGVSRHTFATEADLARYVERRRPGREYGALWGLATVVGAALVLASLGAFRAAFVALVGWLAGGFAGGLTAWNLAVVAGFLLGFGLLSAGLDRLTVGGLRLALAHVG